MGFLDRLFGRNRPREQETHTDQPASPGQPRNLSLTDQQAIERYQYMLRTAPPEAIEQAHEEAFAKLTPEQRQMVLSQLSTVTPENERPASATDDPRALAHMATRAEVRQPGTLVNIFGKPITTPDGASGSGSSAGASNAAPNYGGYSGYSGYSGYGSGFMGGFGGSLLSSVAGAFIGTAIANTLFDNFAYDQGYNDGFDQDQGNDQPPDNDTGDSQDASDTQTMDYGTSEPDPADQQDWGGDTGDTGDAGNADYGGSDYGDTGDYGGDFGGGDFGGGDF